MASRVRRTGQFFAKGQSGESVRVNEYTTEVDVRTLLDDGPKWQASMAAYKLDDGSHVNANDDGTFTVVRTGEVLRRLP